MTTAIVNHGGTDVYVLVKCYIGDGAFVYAAHFPVDANKNAQIGPLDVIAVVNSAATCTAEERYFTGTASGNGS
jgi:hypothetical protein